MKKKTASAVSLLLLLLLLCSCGITDIFEHAGVTMAPTVQTKAPETTTARAEVPELKETPMDFAGTDLSPYISLDYKGIALKTQYEIRDITDEILETELRDLLLYYKKYTLDTSRKTEKDDTVEVSYTGYMDGEPLSNGSEEHVTLVLNDDTGGYIPGFANGLIGKMPGEQVTLDLTFPENYYQEIAGKPVTFRFEIHGICNVKLTDAYAAELSEGKYPSAAEYRTYFRQYLEEMDRYLQFNDVYEALWTELENRAEIKKYPQKQLDYYYAYRVYDLSSIAAAYGMTYEDICSYYGYTEEAIRTEAEDLTRQDLIRYYIANTEDILVDDAAYREYLEGIVERYSRNGQKYDADTIEAYFDSMYGTGYLRAKAQEERIADAVYGYAVITVVSAETSAVTE